MSNWREIDRLRRDPPTFRALAKRVVAFAGGELTEWETEFLGSIVAKPNAFEDYSTRQGEKLLQIRDDHEIVETLFGFSIPTLLRNCYEARLDLSEDDEQWIVALRARAGGVKRRQAFRLLQLARSLGIVETVFA